MNLSIILGPTASGKTKLATHLAAKIKAEIISADSRQVYRGMDLGTGKDLEDYIVGKTKIPYHLIDILPAGAKYNLNDFQTDFYRTYDDVKGRNNPVIMVGGTGMYIEAILKNYQYTAIPVNQTLRKELEKYPQNKLVEYLKEVNHELRKFDLSTKKRLIRAIEISQYLNENPQLRMRDEAQLDYKLFGIELSRNEILDRIQIRIEERLKKGMIDEVVKLIEKGVSVEVLKYYGLEYKIITEYLEGKYQYEEMKEKLFIGIRQYAKRQMTWFRRMQRNGFKIHWVDGSQPLKDQVKEIYERII